MLRRRIIFAICLLAFPAACSSQPAKVTSEIKPAAAKTLKDPKIWLNRDPMGSASDVSKLETKLRNIFEQREKNGDYLVTTGNDPETLTPPPLLRDGVYLLVAPDVSVGDFQKVYDVLDDAGTVFVPRHDSGVAQSKPLKPNPFLLVATVGTKEIDLFETANFEDLDLDGKYSYDLLIFRSVDAADIWYNRIGGVIEILADGSYIVNERYENIDRKKPLDAYPPKQRRASSNLKQEVVNLMRPLESGKNDLWIIANESAPYKSLDEILKLATELKLHFQISVNPQK